MYSIPQTGWLRDTSSNSSGVWKSKIRLSVWLSLDGHFLLGCRLLTTSYCILSGRDQREARGLVTFSGTNPIHQGSTLMTSSDPNYLPKAPLPNTISQSLRFLHEFQRDTDIPFITQDFIFLTPSPVVNHTACLQYHSSIRENLFFSFV